jgi:hypothetical protein
VTGGAIVRGKLSGWAIFLAVLLLLSFAATPSFKYSRAADLSLMAVRFSLVVLLSVLVVREKWRQRDGSDHPQTTSDANDTVLQRFRRWYYDDRKTLN